MNMNASGLVADMGASKAVRACGLCGAQGKMSRTHVPPRAAGTAEGSVDTSGVVVQAAFVGQ